MYGKWVTVDLGEDIQCKVWVSCVPSTPDDVLRRLAMNTLKSRMPEKKTGIMGLGDTLTVISDYEYSQGYGMRYEMEQELKEMTLKDTEKSFYANQK